MKNAPHLSLKYLSLEDSLVSTVTDSLTFLKSGKTRFLAAGHGSGFFCWKPRRGWLLLAVVGSL